MGRLQLTDKCAVDLSRFTCLKVLHLETFYDDLEEHLESLVHIITSISSNKLGKLHIYRYSRFSPTACSSVNSTLTAFVRLKVLDDLLSLPRFSSLHRVIFYYSHLQIYVQAIPNTSLFPSRGSIASIILGASSRRPIPSDELVSSQPNSREISRDDPQHPFKLYAEDLIRRKIRESLKRFAARGSLETILQVYLEPEQELTRAQVWMDTWGRWMYTWSRWMDTFVRMGTSDRTIFGV